MSFKQSLKRRKFTICLNVLSSTKSLSWQLIINNEWCLSACHRDWHYHLRKSERFVNVADYSLGNVKASQFPLLSAICLTWQVSSLKKKKGGEENSSNLCWWKHGFPSEQWFCFGLTVEKKEQVTWPAQKIWELQFARGQVSCLGSIELYFCPVLIAFPGHRHSRVWAEKGPGWMLAGRDYHESPCLPTIPQLSTATHALLWHIYRISTKQLSRTVTD